MGKVRQEFYCSESGGGCGGYIVVKINAALDGVHTVVCPNCGHEHQRRVENGHIVEEGRFVRGMAGKRHEKLYPTMAAFSTEPHTKYMLKHGGGNGDYIKERNAGVIKGKRSLRSNSMLRNLWFERFGVKK